MNTLLSMEACCDIRPIEVICTTIIWVAAIIAGTCLLTKVAPAVRDCFKPKQKDSGGSKESPEDAAYKREQLRKEKVRALMREICEMTKDPDPAKGNDGVYNDKEANKLFSLYMLIDEYDKTGKIENEKTKS